MRLLNLKLVSTPMQFLDKFFCHVQYIGVEF